VKNAKTRKLNTQGYKTESAQLKMHLYMVDKGLKINDTKVIIENIIILEREITVFLGKRIFRHTKGESFLK
jgi:hypothetical protein